MILALVAGLFAILALIVARPLFKTARWAKNFKLFALDLARMALMINFKLTCARCASGINNEVKYVALDLPLSRLYYPYYDLFVIDLRKMR
jgi:hypothetical protein